MTAPSTYRKKPIEIQAMQWTTADDAYALVEWADAHDGANVGYDPDCSGPSHPQTGDDWGRLAVETPEGDMVMTPGDWLIRGVHGEFYPCKPDIFAASYVAVEAGAR